MNSNNTDMDQDNTAMNFDFNTQSNNNNNSNSNPEQEVRIDEMRQELLIKRDTRNTSEKFHDQDLPDTNSIDFDNKNQDDSTRESSPQISPASMENLDEPPLQLPSPALTHTQQNAIQVMSGSIMSLLHNVVSPTREPTLPRLAQPIENYRPRPSSLLSLLTSLPIFNQHRNTSPQSITNHEEGQGSTNNNDTEHEQVNQSQDNHIHDHDLDNMNNGAIIVRTITPGPNGLMIVRMRVIPFDDIFGSQGDNAFGGDDHLNIGLFGALVRMLASSNHFHMERGLEKETLDSLPVVKYDSEGFKNVDEENKRCPICFEDYEDGHEIKYLWCLHRFHKGCADQWLSNHSNCPICKKDFSEVSKESYE